MLLWVDSRDGNRFAKSQSSSSFSVLRAAVPLLASCQLAAAPSVSVGPSSSGFGHRNKIKCGEEKTPLVFGDIAIVIGGEREGGRRKKYANLSRKDRKGSPLLPTRPNLLLPELSPHDS